MDKKELETAMFTIALFSLGAVAIILYQHSVHTGQIVSAINSPGSSPGTSGTIVANAKVNPSAGGITPGQSNQVPIPSSVGILTSGANWQFD